MVFALVLLAQLATSPAPTPTAALGTTAGSVSARPRTLADFAREKKLGKKSVGGGTLSVAGASGSTGRMDPEEAQSPGASASPAKARVRAAEAEVQAARRALDDAAVRTGMTSENTAAMRARLAQARRDLADAKGAAAAR
jgi:hypothetical protein